MPAASLAALVFAVPSFGDAEAERYLRLSMGRSFGRPIVAMMEQRDPFALTTSGPDAGGERVRTKIERDAKGRVRSTILRPLRLQGVTILDDGRRMTIRLPDQKLVIEQDSPALDDAPVEDRLDLVRSNYTLKAFIGPETLGRPTVLIQATAKRRGLDTRRYLLDAATGFPLKSELVSSAGRETVFETMMLRFVKELPDRTFRQRPTRGFQVVRYASPTAPKPGEALRKLGFEPAIPQDPPFGFRVTGVAMIESSRWKSVTIRLTDGLVKANVYEWTTGPEDAALGDGTVQDGRGRSIGRRRGRTVLVVAETSPLVRARLLEAVLEALP